MENILAKFVRRVFASFRSNDLRSRKVELFPVPFSELSQEKQRIISANKTKFAEIFGEEAPEWWGNFNFVDVH